MVTVVQVAAVAADQMEQGLGITQAVLGTLRLQLLVKVTMVVEVTI